MKTLVISRPDGLRLFLRVWPFMRKYDGLSHKQLEDGFRKIYTTQPESFTKDAALVQIEYCARGSQMVCESMLSRDLEVSKVSGDIASLTWPAEALWITFQDQDLPSCMLAKRIAVTNGMKSVGFCLVMANKDGAQNGIMIGQAEWASYIEGGSYPEFPVANGDVVMPNEEVEAVRYMAGLCSKVLAYASIPHHASPCLVTREQKRAAGLHPHYQSSSPAVLVRYLPRIEHEKIEQLTGSGAHAFYGRAGHIRLYKDERYVNMLGKWQWIPPIRPPDGVKVIYKVRKVAA
jgi:hypothetical protein